MFGFAQRSIQARKLSSRLNFPTVISFVFTSLEILLVPQTPQSALPVQAFPTFHKSHRGCHCVGNYHVLEGVGPEEAEAARSQHFTLSHSQQLNPNDKKHVVYIKNTLH